jgi:hypothetical protein
LATTCHPLNPSVHFCEYYLIGKEEKSEACHIVNILWFLKEVMLSSVLLTANYYLSLHWLTTVASLSLVKIFITTANQKLL